MLLTLETCTSALNAALVNRRAAIRLELSVGLAVFHLHGGTGKDARTMLASAYATAGYQCEKFADPEYKTVNRRINATASLYEKLPIAKWVGQLVELELIHAIYDGIGPYELHSIQDVLRYAAPHKVQQHKTPVVPDTSILAGPVAHTGQAHVMGMFRRASDQNAEGMRRIATEHISVTIPKDAGRDELIELATKLMLLAKDGNKQLLTA